jgi:hypothetical protein
MEQMPWGSTKFIMDASFRLAAMKRFNVILERSTIGECFLPVNEDKPLVRLDSQSTILQCYCAEELCSLYLQGSYIFSLP